MCDALIDRPAGPTGLGPRLLRIVRRGLTRCVPDRPTRPAHEHFRGVIFKVDRIGDFVLAVGAIRLLLREWGEQDCLLVVSALTEELVAREFPRTRRITLPPFVGHGRLWREARAARRRLSGISCDVAITLRHQRWDFDELSLSWLHATRVHVLEDVTRRSMFAERRTWTLARATRTIFQDETTMPDIGGMRLCRELQMHRQLLSVALGRTVKSEEVLPKLTVPPALAPGPAIVCPLGSHALRDLPAECLVAALTALQAAHVPAVVMGSPDQAARLTEIVATLRRQGFPEVSARTDLALPDFVSALAAAPIVVTTESAAAHLATALDRPVVVMIGGGHYDQFGPWRRSTRQIWLAKPMDCFGCNWHCVHPEPYCLTQLPSDSVGAAVTRLLEQREAG